MSIVTNFQNTDQRLYYYCMKTAIVIGGGISGLAIAALLGKNGYKVKLFEKNKELGGRARVWQKNGFKFDMGPSWYMMPEVMDEFFADFGKKVSDYFELLPVKPRYKVFYEGGESLEVEYELSKNVEMFERIEKGAGRKLIGFLKKMRPVYEAAAKKLVYVDYQGKWFDKYFLEGISKTLGAMWPFQSWHKLVGKYFKDDRLKKILEFPAVFLGGSPYNTPALYGVMAVADFDKKIWYPRGGMGKLISALKSLALEQGVEIVTGKEVKKINVQEGKVVDADVVVNSSDYANGEINLLDEEYKSICNWEDKKLSISGLILYLGIKGKLKKLVHHNLYFSKDWKNNFEAIFDKKVWSNQPSIYISARSKSDLSIVPDGCEELMVLVPCATGLEVADCMVEEVISMVEEIAGEKIRNRILVKRVFTPTDFKNDYNAFGGTALGLAHTLNQSLWFRPGNRSVKVKGLYYTGQYTNPGVGVPMALASAKIVEKIIKDGAK